MAVARMNKRGTWEFPCGKSVSAAMNETKPANLSRHEVAKRLKAIKTQIGIATKYFKKEQKNIDNLYSKIANVNIKVNYDWLPENQFQWYKTEGRCLNKPSRIERVLTMLDSSLQNYAVTFQALLNITKPESYLGGEFKIRIKTLDGMAQHLNQILCEVVNFLHVMGYKRTEKIGDDFLKNKPDKWNSHPDYTNSQVQEWGVLSLYKKFLVDWFRIMEKVNKNTSCKKKNGKQ